LVNVAILKLCSTQKTATNTDRRENAERSHKNLIMDCL